MHPTLLLRPAANFDRAPVQAFYRNVGYSPVISDDDRIFLAHLQDDLVGVARLCLEEGTHVLRGVQVHPSHQRQGIGTALIDFVVAQIANRTCYCLPFTHLLELYRRAGFDTVTDGDAPPFLLDRANRYRRKGEDIAIMALASSPRHHRRP